MKRRRANTASGLTEQDLSDFLDCAPLCMHSLGTDGTILWANRPELAMLGYTAEEYVGHSISEFHVNRECVERIMSLLAGVAPLPEIEAILRCKDQSVRHVRMSFNCRWEKGRCVSTKCFTRDMATDQKTDRPDWNRAAALDASCDAIISKDLNGIITGWNRGATKIYGYTADEAIGQPISILMPSGLRDEQFQILDKLSYGEHIQHYETVRQAKDGRILDISLTISPIRNESGNIIGAFKIARDITERKHQERQSQTSAQLIRNALELGRLGTWEWDVSSGKVTWSPIMESLHGLAPGSFTGTWDAYVAQVDRQDRDNVARTLRSCIEDGESHDVEYRIILPDGRSRWIWATCRQRPCSNGDAIVSGVCMDMTSRRELDQERDRLRAAEQVALLAAESATRAKDEFLSTVSHELRTPLNAILSWAHLLRTCSLDQASTVRAVETIERNAKIQARLIETILDVSRITSGKIRLNIRPVDPIAFIEPAVEAIRPAANAKNIHMVVSLANNVGLVAGDPDRLQQVVWNLLSNATKFTPGNGSVQLDLQRSGTHAEIVVSDTGAGIAEEFLPCVFEPFQQADRSTTRERGGVGLGLAIVRHLVELHGGRISVESRGPGEGTRFCVVLPTVPGASPQVAP